MSVEENRNPYDLVFGLAYASNAFLLIAVSLLFRYSDFVKVHGGSEWELGWIVGIGAAGAIASRFFQGFAIDRFGTKSIWLASLGSYSLAVFLHLLIREVDTPWVYMLRMLMHGGLAGTFGASLTFISLRVPARRTTEVLGMHGTSGFVGMACGPIVGDGLFRGQEATSGRVDMMFVTAGIVSCLALLCAALATRGRVKRRRSRKLPILPLIARYNPGVLLLVAAVMGMGLSLPGVFLRPYAESLGIENIRTFFVAYNVVAFTTRVSIRRLPEKLGERGMILIGTSILIASMPTYLLVSQASLLFLPAIVTGFAHAFLFPAVVASGGHAFPARYRGLATTLILGMFDFGNLVGQPLLGGIVTLSRQAGVPAYPTMFLSASLICLVTAGLFACRPARTSRARGSNHTKSQGNDTIRVSRPGATEEREAEFQETRLR